MMSFHPETDRDDKESLTKLSSWILSKRLSMYHASLYRPFSPVLVWNWQPLSRLPWWKVLKVSLFNNNCHFLNDAKLVVKNYKILFLCQQLIGSVYITAHPSLPSSRPPCWRVSSLFITAQSSPSSKQDKSSSSAEIVSSISWRLSLMRTFFRLTRPRHCHRRSHTDFGTEKFLQFSIKLKLNLKSSWNSAAL